jgi:hypothetical protein
MRDCNARKREVDFGDLLPTPAEIESADQTCGADRIPTMAAVTAG